ncbi:MAG: YicC family protein [Flavobacteriales bacterium]|nr:YicC family protein [Flavobacteriales bacterium]MBL6870035.1 YicC family protein [Flavobacteriales bacterium]
MTHSMTGFGKSEVTIGHLHVNIEIRSLNSKFLDLTLKIPTVFKEIDSSLRSTIKNELNRGKIELAIRYEKINSNSKITINKEQLKNYYNQLKEISAELNNQNNEDFMGYALKLPEVIQHQKETVDKQSNEILINAVKQACKDLKSFREKEGKSLQKELLNYVNSIQDNLAKINPFEKERLPKVKQKLLRSVEELNLKSQIDEKRLEQELIYYAEKLDLTEEKVRLKEHCIHFMETLKEINSGKKLGFITQEMGREINTLGSKAHHLSIQKIVVEMKDELEKIKEQVLNIL